MIICVPISSLFDFLILAVMLWVFDTNAAEFHPCWFVGSLATQTVIIFAIRTRRTPLFRSRPSLPLALATLGVVAIGTVLPATSLGHTVGFTLLPEGFYAALAGMVFAYRVLVELAEHIFDRTARPIPTSRGAARAEPGTSLDAPHAPAPRSHTRPHAERRSTSGNRLP